MVNMADRAKLATCLMCLFAQIIISVSACAGERIRAVIEDEAKSRGIICHKYIAICKPSQEKYASLIKLKLTKFVFLENVGSIAFNSGHVANADTAQSGDR